MGKYELADPKHQLALSAARSLLSTAVSITKTSSNAVGIGMGGEKLSLLLTYFYFLFKSNFFQRCLRQNRTSMLVYHEPPQDASGLRKRVFAHLD